MLPYAPYAAPSGVLRARIADDEITRINGAIRRATAAHDRATATTAARQEALAAEAVRDGLSHRLRMDELRETCAGLGGAFDSEGLCHRPDEAVMSFGITPPPRPYRRRNT